MAHADEIDMFAGTVTLTADPDANISVAFEIRSTASVSFQPVYVAHVGSVSADLNFVVQLSADGTNWTDYGDWVHGSSGAYTFRPANFTVDQEDPSPVLSLDDLRSRWMRVKMAEVGTTTTNFGAAKMFAYVSQY